MIPLQNAVYTASIPILKTGGKELERATTCKTGGKELERSITRFFTPENPLLQIS
jgi:hypothetical protein